MVSFYLHNWSIALSDTDIVAPDTYDLIITSPPYNVGKEYESKQSIETYMQEQSYIIGQLCNALKDTGSFCWQVGNYINDGEILPLDILFYDVFKKLGMKLRNRIIWRFGHGLHCKHRFSGRYETMNWWTKTDNYKFRLDSVRVPPKYPNKKYFKGPRKGQLSCNPLGCNPTDVWTIMQNEWDEAFWDVPNVKHNHPEKTNHPCQFPVEIAERCILALTDEEDIVLDPYGGSGSSMIAAVKNNRRGVYVDNNPEYLQIAQSRVHMLREGNLKTRAIGTSIFNSC